MTRKKIHRTPTVLERNPITWSFFGNETGGRCYPIQERVQQRLRRIYSEDTEEWTSYEVGKPPYVRAEMRYLRRLYVGIGHDGNAAWNDLARQLPTKEACIDISVLGCEQWWILHLYAPIGAWGCEGTNPLRVIEKLLRCAERAARPQAWGHTG